MILRWIGLVLILWFLLIGCQEDMVDSDNMICESKEKIEVCELSINVQIVLDTFSSARLSNDTLILDGHAYIKFADSKNKLLVKWKENYIPLRRGMYEICTRNNNYLNVFSGGSKLETTKIRIDIESGSQLKYIAGNHVLIPISDDYPNWIPDSLIYK